MTQNYYPGEASVMVARHLKIVSQSDAFMISATRNIQYVLKKLVGLINFEIDIFDIYLNNMCHIVFSLYLVRKCLGEHWLHALPSNKISQNFTYLQVHEDCVAMETESFILNREFNISEGLFVYVVLQKHYKAIILCFLLKLC